MLPVGLPDVPDYAPRTFEPTDADSVPEAPPGRNPEWVNGTLDLGDGPQVYRRDTNTMPNWAGSCWYYLRYLDPTWGALDAVTGEAANPGEPVVDPKLDNYWMGPKHNATAGVAGGVDLYVGGVEHAVLHLLYARFWHKVLFDLGYTSALEPFGKLFNQGYIQAYAYTDARGAYVPADEVAGDEKVGFTWNGEAVNREYGKMGKSLKNVVTPDEMYAEYGADTFRLYEMSMGPLDLSRPWNTRDVVGSQRYLQRLWRNVVDEETGASTVVETEPDAATLRAVHRAIADVTDEMEGMRPNTAIAKLITLNNHLTGLAGVPRAAIEPLVLMTAPIAPHIAEELWERLGHSESLAREPFPVADPAYLVEDTVTCIVQVQGKVRGRLEVSPSISDADLESAALADPAVIKAIDGRPIRKLIVRAPGLVNVVV
jgi:leucyl-tRNA synthetase